MTDLSAAEQYLANEVKIPNEVERPMNNIFSVSENITWQDVLDDFSHRHNYYIYENHAQY